MRPEEWKGFMNKSRENTFGVGRVGMILALVLFWIWVGPSEAQEKPQYGGTLIFAVGEEPPTYDAHRESTFAVIHPTRSHYNLLLNYDQENYPKIVGELAESWTISPDSKTYTFKIRRGVKFHDGSLLTAKDVKVSYNKIIFPPQNIISTRKAFYSYVEKVEAPDDYTVVFRLKRPAASFLPSVSS